MRAIWILFCSVVPILVVEVKSQHVRSSDGRPVCRGQYTFCNERKIAKGECDDTILEFEENVEGIVNLARIAKKAAEAVGKAIGDFFSGIFSWTNICRKNICIFLVNFLKCVC